MLIKQLNPILHKLVVQNHDEGKNFWKKNDK
jgi:hypothetical protein